MDQQQVRDCLAELTPEALDCDWLSAGALEALEIDDQCLRVALVLGYPCQTVLADERARLQAALAGIAEGRRVELSLRWQVQPHAVQGSLAALPEVANIIAVSSGKGGVGKSTTTVNLALALAAEGARVGVLDADIFGPSIPTMLGVAADTRPELTDSKQFLPVMAHGLAMMSMGLLTDANTPVVFRGPKASGALLQLLEQTRWPALDYLLVDMPPGTSDIPLTLAQRVPVAGAVVVTTPQDIALLDAIKGIELFRKTGIRVLGIIENMAVHVCSACGHQEHVFGSGGGARVAQQYDTALLGSLPLSAGIRAQADSGAPTVISAADSAEAACYRQVARRLTAGLALTGIGRRAFPRIVNH